MTFTRLTVFAATLICATAAFAAQPASEIDRTFLYKVAQGGMFEVEVSRFAATRAASPDVRNLAAVEIQDHDPINREVTRLASSHQITLSFNLDPEFRQRMERLRSLNGPAFDAAYIEEMKQIHFLDEKLFATESTNGTEEFRNFAGQTDPIIRRHLHDFNALRR